MTSSPSSSSDPVSRGINRLDERVRRWIWQAGWTELRDAQERAIEPVLLATHDVIIAASTASGKTEAAFLPILTRLAEAPEELRLALYVSPLKALINDQWARLESLCEQLDVPVTPWHGDIPGSKKARFLKKPAGCLLITPESLEATLMGKGSAAAGIFAGLCYVVIDEMHSFMGTERGKQLQSQLCRIEQLLNRRICRVGLSATLGDMRGAQEYLRASDPEQVELIVSRDRGQELHVLIRGVLEPQSFSAKTEIGDDDDPGLVAKTAIVSDLFKVLRGSNNLVFPNSRTNVEFFADRLRRKCEEQRVPNEFWPHHGNLSKEIREQTEAALKQKEVPASAICTSTLELGIDIGSVKSVVQIGPPPSVASLRQRLGRSGRRKGEPAILRGYATERQLSPVSEPSDLLREGLIQSVAMVQLLVRGWYEPVGVRGLHVSTMVQQVLSLISQFGAMTASRLWDMLVAHGAFDGFPRESFAQLLRGLGAKEVIMQDATGLILLAPLGERICAHYSFYAAFSSTEEYRLVCNGQTLGSLPVSRPLAEGSFVIFGGRRWQVTSISNEELVIVVVPGAGGTLPSFEGAAGASVHDGVRAEMRTLLGSQTDVPFLDKAAREMLVEARGNYRAMNLDQVMVRRAGANIQLFGWRGDRVHDTLSLILLMRGIAAALHGIYVSVESVRLEDVRDVLEEIAGDVSLDAISVASSVKNKEREKWDGLVPDEVLAASFASQHLDVTGAKELAHELVQSTR